MSEPCLEQLCQNYTKEEIIEIKSYLSEWSAASYLSIAHNILDHADRKQIDPLKLLRKAHNFNKKRAMRIPPKNYRQDQSAVYRKNNEYLIVRLDPSGIEKIVTYGVN
ncbi:MAG: hypothetical protein ACKO5Q_06115 [Microcystaceae cyanobacterium]